MKKKRILIIGILIFLFAVYFSINVNADCACNPECNFPGTFQYGGVCGPCDSRLREDCSTDCISSGWYCQNNVPSNFGQSCNCGACGCGGTIQCNSACSGGNPTPSNYGQSCGSCGGTITCSGSCSVGTPSNFGQSCGNCGTIGCSGTCINQGPCSPSARQCSGSTTQVCSSSCQWQNEQNCDTSDGWFGGGNTQTASCGSVDNDASSEFRNYGCSSGSCTYGVTQTQDCDGSDGWYGGGNNAGCGSDPSSVWNDYYVTANTGSCTSTTTCSGSGSVNCDNNDVCNNKCEGTVFTSVPPMKDYYVVSNSNSCTSTTDSPVTEDCATKTSTDTDNSPIAYTVPGSVTDYNTCTLGGCTGTTYSDSCSGTVLTEYGASGSSFTSSAYECQNFEINYCSGGRYFRNEWACTGSPGACTDAADTQIGINADSDSKDKECGDSLCDNAAGVYDSTKTATEINCADNLDNDCDGAKDCADSDCVGKTGPGGVLCCQSASNCAQDDCKIESCTSNTCQYSNRNACDSTECTPGSYCNSAGGDCKNPDQDSNVCLNCIPDNTAGYTWSWSTSKFEDAGKAYGTELFNSNNAGCTAESGGVCFDNTGKTAAHKAALTTGNCCGDDSNEYYKSDYFGPECVSSLNDCVWSTGDAQSSDSGNPGWWCYLGKWDECTKKADIGKHFGSVVCAGAGTGWTLNPLPENQYGQNACSDGLDNDADGTIDCNDSDCSGSITGTVKNQEQQPISSADVTLKKDLTTINSTATSQTGTYTLSSVNCGTYNLIASHADYAPQTKTTTVSPAQQVTIDFNLALGTSCEQDCTFAAGDIIHASCDGKNGCTFYDSIAKAACDNSQPGWLRDYNETHYVTCASGAPQSKVEIVASLSCESGTLVKVTRIVIYNGEPVKLVVAACG